MEFCIAADHPALPGHFPGHPIVPGVVILDHVLAAIELVHGPLAGLRLPQVKFVQPLLPGQVARIELDVITADVIAPDAIAPDDIARDDTERDVGAKSAGNERALRWRFRVLRDAQLLASGEVVPA
ncbi:MAG: hypothetical protein ACOH1R_06265 [Luteimonas sp.]